MTHKALFPFSTVFKHANNRNAHSFIHNLFTLMVDLFQGARSSTNPCEEEYIGEEGGSELETKAIMGYYEYVSLCIIHAIIKKIIVGVFPVL